MPRKTKKSRRGRAAGARRRQRAGARRFVLLFLFVLIGLLYAGPLRSYYAKRELVAHQSAQIAQLDAEKQSLQKKLKWASTRTAAEREARRLFYIKPGERLYVVDGIERWRQSNARSRE